MPRPARKMTFLLSSALQRTKNFLTPAASSDSLSKLSNGQRISVKATDGNLFPKVAPAVDGEDCNHDCQSCTVNYPPKFKIEENDRLYGYVHGWATHLLVATGKTDWTREIENEKGSVMEAIGKYGKEPSNGKLMLSASNIPLPDPIDDQSSVPAPTTALLLPAFTLIENVTPASVPDLITNYISTAPTTSMPLPDPSIHTPSFQLNGTALTSSPPTTPTSTTHPTPLATPLTTRPCPHNYLILLCSQRSRDARCGQSAPLLRKEFERHLRPLGLYRDLHDERPGGVGIYFISHVGGHKYSANVMIYRRHTVAAQDVTRDGADAGQAGQCIWLARVRPEDCEGIVKFTVLQGKVVKPERQLRGGFDREKGLVSW